MHTIVLSLCEWIRAQGERASDLILCEHVSFMEESRITVFSKIWFTILSVALEILPTEAKEGESKGGREDP